MRGIMAEHVQRVVLATGEHPKIHAFQRWLARRTAADLEAKFHERRQERALLTTLLGAPMEDLLTPAAMVEHYRQSVVRTQPRPTLPPPTCRDCRHCREDRYAPGRFVCWEGWTSGRPKRLSTLTVCGAFHDTRPTAAPRTWYDLKEEMGAYLAAHGIHYNAARWKAHQHDLRREAGTWGFGVGTTWEAKVRAWLSACYGEAFFLPERWLIVWDRSGTTHYREVDGIEVRDAHHVFVYEIKHRTAAYDQLTKEYVPLLKRVYPEAIVTPIEINASNPYHAMPEASSIRVIDTMDKRTPNGRYQLLVLSTMPGEEGAHYCVPVPSPKGDIHGPR